MQNHEETKKILSGLLIGVVGAGALYCIYASKHHKTPLIKKIGRTIADIGEMIEHTDLKSVSHVADCIEKNAPSGKEMISNLGQLLANGISLWKKISK